MTEPPARDAPPPSPDETALAFAHPADRAVAAAAPGTFDRIMLRDHVALVEIGAFAEERGHPQRLRFDVVVELGAMPGPVEDDVDRILSYDLIAEAIADELAARRPDLLETLAEGIAARLLVPPQAARVFVRVQKLDRGPGALGVEIARVRRGPPPAAAAAAAPPLVVLVGAAALTGGLSAELAGRLAALAAVEEGAPLLICPDLLGPDLLVTNLRLPDPPATDPPATDPPDTDPPVTNLPASDPPVPDPPAPAPPGPMDPAIAWRITLLSFDQMAWRLAAALPQSVVAASQTEIAWALRRRPMVIWAPAKAVLDSPVPPAANPLALAGWIAGRLGARGLVVLDPEPRRVPIPPLPGPG